jgi:hydroxymethylbilane synthase
MTEKPIRLGTRGSALALAQAKAVSKALPRAEVVPIKTSDQHQTGRPSASPAGRSRVSGGDKARFVREIEGALLSGDVDLGVHSAKDLPSDLPDGLEIAGVLAREDPRDAYVGEAGSLDEIPEGATIGTSSLRRRSQLLARRPDLEVTELRGNVDTRLRRLQEGDFDGLVLAAAGLRRLGRAGEIGFEIDPGVLTPAPGQGALALEARADDRRAAVAAESITDRNALGMLAAERAVVAVLDASCDTPVGAQATIEGGRMRLRGYCGLPDGSEWIRDEVIQDASDPEAIGGLLAERMTSAGADQLLARASELAAAGGMK